MYAVITTGGKQYKVANDDTLEIERLADEVGSKIQFSEVLAIGENDKVTFGTPFLKDASVEAEVVDHYRGSKITVFKMKKRKSYRRKQGHRQEITKIKITDIIEETSKGKKTVKKEVKTTKEVEAPTKEVKVEKNTKSVKDEKAKKEKKTEKE